MTNYVRPLATLALPLFFLLAACTREDHRLTDDQQSCLQMGHTTGTPEFERCMEDLNQRRCATAATKAGSRHVATEECTRLP
jgi:hypothetical protein